MIFFSAPTNSSSSSAPRTSVAISSSTQPSIATPRPSQATRTLVNPYAGFGNYSIILRLFKFANRSSQASPQRMEQSGTADLRMRPETGSRPNTQSQPQPATSSVINPSTQPNFDGPRFQEWLRLHPSATSDRNSPFYGRFMIIYICHDISYLSLSVYIFLEKKNRTNLMNPLSMLLFQYTTILNSIQLIIDKKMSIFFCEQATQAPH